MARRNTMRLTITTLIAFSAIHALTAQTAPEMQDRLEGIREIGSESDRLNAYDTYVDEVLAERSMAETGDQPETGNWNVDRSADPISDATQVFFMLMATEGTNSYGRPPALVVRQQGGSLDVYIVWNEYLSEDRQRVTHRIDDEPPETLRWSVSTDNSATFYPSSDLELVQQLLRSESLVVRTTPYNESPMTVTFDVRGFEAAARPYADDLPGWFSP
jgi:type VI secretion system protein VasI